MVKVGVFLFAACLALPVGAARIPNGKQHPSVDLGGISLEMFTDRGKNCTPSARLLVFHGLHWDVEENRGDLHPVADEWCMLDVASFLDERRFPGWRYI